jgi:hypothetical protein
VYANYLIDQKIPCDGSFIEVQKWNLLNKETTSLQILVQIDEEEIELCLPLHADDVKRKGQTKLLEASKKQEIKIALHYNYNGYFIESIQQTICGQFTISAVTEKNGNYYFEGQLIPDNNPKESLELKFIKFKFGKYKVFEEDRDLWNGVKFDIEADWNAKFNNYDLKKCTPCLKEKFRGDVTFDGMLKLDDGTDLYRLKVEKNGTLLYVKKSSFGYKGIHKVEESKPFFIELSFYDNKDKNEHDVWSIQKIGGVTDNIETDFIFQGTLKETIDKTDGDSFEKESYIFKLDDTPFTISIEVLEFLEQGIASITEGYKLKMQLSLVPTKSAKWKTWKLINTKLNLSESLKKHPTNEIPIRPLLEWSSFTSAFAQGNPYKSLLQGFYNGGALLRTDLMQGQQGVEFLLRVSKPLLTAHHIYRLPNDAEFKVTVLDEVTESNSPPVFSIASLKFDLPINLEADDCFTDEAKYSHFEKNAHVFSLQEDKDNESSPPRMARYYEFKKETSNEENSPLLETLINAGGISELSFDVEVEKFRDKLIISKIIAVRNINYAAR